MDIESVLEWQARELKVLRMEVDSLKRQETPVVGLGNAFLAAQDGRIGTAEAQLAQMDPTALAWAVYHAVPLLFPNLIGVWYMNQAASGQLWDAASQSRHLTRFGSMAFNQVGTGLVRAAVLNGTDSYASRASEAALEITSNLSIMTWTYKSVSGIQHPILAKTQGLAASTNFAYWLLQGSGDSLNFAVCNGSTIKNVTKDAPVGAWYFGAGAYSVSVSVSAYLGTQDGWEDPQVDTSSIPSSVNPATSTNLTMGAIHGGANVGNGYVAMVALMNSTSNETLFRNYFEFTKGLFYGFN